MFVHKVRTTLFLQETKPAGCSTSGMVALVANAVSASIGQSNLRDVQHCSVAVMTCNLLRHA